MSQLPPADAEQLGRRLYLEGFQPLPDINDEGGLIGTILWRLRAGHVDYLALRTNGFALAARATVSFNYRAPHLFGPVVGHQTGHAFDALEWLLHQDIRPSDQRGPREG